MPTRERVTALVERVQRNQFVEAIEAFYAEDASMQENLAPPRVGRTVLVEHERATLAAMTIRTVRVPAVLIDGDRVVIHWVFEIDRGGRRFELDELAHQRWDGDRIVEERFYYDPAQRR